MSVGLSLKGLIREIRTRVDEAKQVELEALCADIFANRIPRAEVGASPS